MEKQKRVAAIHDISGFGKCSLTVALPIISATGVEVSVIPTAVLSTHTGGIPGFTYRDLTMDIRPIADHWKSLDIQFEAIYTGYLGSFEQLEIVESIFDDFKKNDTLVFVDPVMADDGKLYVSFPEDFPNGMRKLCQKADVIVPNITEACLLINEPYMEGPYKQDYIEGILRKLSDIGPNMVVLTGVYFDEDRLGAAAYDKKKDSFSYAFSEKIEGSFHGTGDIFGSILLSTLMNGFNIDEGLQIAADFTTNCIRRTKEAGTDRRFGVNFEAGIPELLKRMKKL
ncbi:MAG: pdxK [Clostridiales bacterium]|nr:pdxK [Clostridiales bacterium]